MKVALVEDSRLAREEMKRMLAAHDDIQLVGEAANADEAETLIAERTPDLIFLDIQMPGRSGFELLEILDCAPLVVFCTAYSDFAVRAFEANALDYLVKPVQPERLKESLDRARARLIETNTPQRRELLTSANRIFVRDGDHCWFVTLGDVRLFEVEGSYTRLHFGEHRVLIPKSLNYLESRLDPETFFRTSRQHIVNLQWVRNMETSVSGSLELTLKDGKKIEVSRRQTQKFKDAMSL